MRVVSVSVGRPRELQARGHIVTTSILKEPVSGRVAVRSLNLDGDQQSDLSVHGGVDKAVYVYPSEHYAFWREALSEDVLPWGRFGENLTTEGLLEDAVCIGDRLQIGSAEFQVTQPRTPCFKLGACFDRPDMEKRFLASGRTGFYLRVLREGDIAAGDSIVMTEHDPSSATVIEVLRLYTASHPALPLLRNASQLPGLSAGWREYFCERLLRAD